LPVASAQRAATAVAANYGGDCWEMRHNLRESFRDALRRGHLDGLLSLSMQL
jgi:hypothetical protein